MSKGPITNLEHYFEHVFYKNHNYLLTKSQIRKKTYFQNSCWISHAHY